MNGQYAESISAPSRNQIYAPQCSSLNGYKNGPSYYSQLAPNLQQPVDPGTMTMQEISANMPIASSLPEIVPSQLEYDPSMWNGQAGTPPKGYREGSTLYPGVTHQWQGFAAESLTNSRALAAGTVTGMHSPLAQDHHQSNGRNGFPETMGSMNAGHLSQTSRGVFQEAKFIQHVPENHAAKQSGLLKGRCIQCMIAEVECRGRGENRNRCDRCERINYDFYCRGPVPRLTIIDTKGEWSPFVEQLRADLAEGFADVEEPVLKQLDLSYTWRSNFTSGSHRRCLKFLDGSWSCGDPIPSGQFLFRRYNMSRLECACISFILVLQYLRSPSRISVEMQCGRLKKPSQVLAIIEDFGLQAQALLQEICNYVEDLLINREVRKESLAQEAFNLGLVWKELVQFLTIPHDWRQLENLTKLMDPLVDRTPTLMKHLKLLGAGINAVEFRKGQHHSLEDFQCICFSIQRSTDVANPNTASFGNLSSFQDILLRRQPNLHLAKVYEIISYHERQIEGHSRELDRHHKALQDLRSQPVFRVDIHEGPPVLNGLATPPNTANIIMRRNTSIETNENESTDEATTTVPLCIGSQSKPSPATRQPNPDPPMGEASRINGRKRKPTDSADLEIKTQRKISPLYNSDSENNPPLFLIGEGSCQQEFGAEQAASAKSHTNDESSMPCETTLTQLDKRAGIESAEIEEEISTGFQSQAGTGPQDDRYSDRITLCSPVADATDDGYNNESYTEFIATMVDFDKTTDSFLLSPKPDHETCEKRLPQEKLDPRKKSLFSVERLLEKFRDRNRPASYPPKSMRNSMQLGIRKMSHWLKEIHVCEKPNCDGKRNWGTPGL